MHLHCRCWKEIIIFIMLVIFMISFFALMSLPGSLQSSIIDNFHINTSKFALLNSIGSWAALIDVIHGYILDRYLGVKVATAIYCSIMIIGCVLFSMASFTKGYGLLMIGRTIYGVGSNPLLLCTNKHIIHWFGSGKHINLVYSVTESIVFAGTSLSFFISIRILDYVKTNWPNKDSLGITMTSENVFFGSLLLVTSAVMALMFDWKETDVNETTPLEEDRKEEKKLVFRDYVITSPIFWAFALTIFLYFVATITFINLSQDFFITVFGVSTTYASTMTALSNILAALIGPFVGLTLDKIGQNLTCLTLGYTVAFISLGLFGCPTVNPLVAVVLMGMSTGSSASLWSQIQFLVEDHQQMVAYGVGQTGLNGAMAVGSVVAGMIIDAYGYYAFIYYLMITTGCGMLALVLVWILNCRRGNTLNLTPNKRQQCILDSRKTQGDAIVIACHGV